MKKSLAHPQRRWRGVTKDELDADLNRSGKPIALTDAQRKSGRARSDDKIQKKRRETKRLFGRSEP
jgi:hypothetical protein